MRIVPKKECDLCGKVISNANFSKHRGSKQCLNPYTPIEQKLNPDNSCIFCGKIYSEISGIRNHQLRCKLNPESVKRNEIYKTSESYLNRKISNQYIKAKELGLDLPTVSKETRLKMSENSRGKKQSEETKKIISEKMKLAHKEGRAWNIGKSRWNNKPSYPEKYFKTVFENELKNINFKIEHPVGIYSLDFAWLDLKKCIEIDGEQHYRFQEYIDRDARKEKKLREEGWELMRIRWKDYLKNKQKYIDEIKTFIEN